MARNLSSPTNPLRKLFGADAQEDLFRTLADRLERAVLILSPDGARVLTCNHALLLMTGFSRTELERMRPSDLFQGEPGARALTNLLQTSPGQLTHAKEVPLQTRRGQTILVDLEASPAGAAESPILLLLSPSQERRQRESAASTRQQRLSGLAEMSRQLLSADVTTLPAALEQVKPLINAACLAIYRVSPTQPDYILDGALPDSFPQSLASAAVKSHSRQQRWSLGERPDQPLHKAARVSGLGALISSQVGAENAWVGLLVAGWETPDDLPPDVEDLLSIIASLCHVAIQLSLQQANVAGLGAAMQGLQAEASGQLDAVNDALLGLDADLKIARINRSARSMLGYPQDNLVGVPVQDVLVGPEDITATLLDALGHELIAERPKVTLHRRDGTPFPVHLRAVPMAKDSPTRLLVVLDDQSERQAIEDQNELLAQRALLGEVSAIFAHEVRNPINNISTGIQLVASRLGQEHPLYGSLDRVRRECNRLDQLMSDVLFFTRRLELKMEPLDLGQMLQRMLERWRPRLEQAHVRSHMSLEPAAPPVLADPRTLEQVFINLITNAVQAMPDGGTLSLTVAPVASSHGAFVEVRLADTGPGISQEQIERIFDPFFTTKKEGTGLGLAISRRIISAHKGSIQVESFPDAGTVFTIQLPTAEETSEVQAA